MHNLYTLQTPILIIMIVEYVAVCSYSHELGTINDGTAPLCDLSSCP